MGWASAEPAAKAAGIQRNLFLELTDEEELVVRILTHQGDLHINALVVEADIPVNRMSALLFELEMKGVVKAVVGGVYSFFACLPNVYSFSENLLVFFYKYLLFSDTFDILT